MDSGSIRRLIESDGEDVNTFKFNDPRWKLRGTRTGNDGRVDAASYGSVSTDITFKVVKMHPDWAEWSVYVYDRGDIIDGQVGDIDAETYEEAAARAIPHVDRMLAGYSTTLHRKIFQ